MSVQPQTYLARFEDKQVHNEKFSHYQFELTQPHRLDFRAGSYLSLKINEQGERRSYSIMSDPDIDHGVEILVDTTPQGPGVEFLEGLEFGAEVEFIAPLGQFHVADNPQEKALTFVATGSGIAPLYSMIVDQLKNKEDQRPMVLYWGLRHVDDLIWEDELSRMMKNFDNFRFHPTLSQAVKDWPLCRGRVTDCLSIHQLLDQSGYYLCGNQEMIAQVESQLQAKGVDSGLIHYEKFY